MNLTTALKLVGTLAAAFPRQELTDETLEVYARDLLDLPDEIATLAFETVRKQLRFFPTIAEIREAAAEIILDAPAPMEAWEQARHGGDCHGLVRLAKRRVGDPYDWRVGDSNQLRPSFLGAYKEVRADAITELTVPRSLPAAPPQLQLLPAEGAGHAWARALAKLQGDPTIELDGQTQTALLRAGITEARLTAGHMTDAEELRRMADDFLEAWRDV